MTAMWQKAARAARPGAASGACPDDAVAGPAAGLDPTKEIGGPLVSLRHHRISCRSKTA
jgi:hypothetical protein